MLCEFTFLAKRQWLQDPNQSNVDNVISVRCEAGRHSRTKRGIIQKLKLMNLKQTNKKIRDLYRSVIEFKKGCQPRTSIVQDEKHDLVADTHSILARRRNHFSQLLNVHGDNDIR